MNHPATNTDLWNGARQKYCRDCAIRSVFWVFPIVRQGKWLAPAPALARCCRRLHSRVGFACCGKPYLQPVRRRDQYLSRYGCSHLQSPWTTTAFRDECLNENWFEALDQARHTRATWRTEYNEAKQQDRYRNQLILRTPDFWNLNWYGYRGQVMR